MKIVSTIRRMLRGEVSSGTATLEAIRRVNSGLEGRKERRELDSLNREPGTLTEEFARMPKTDLLAYFRTRESPQFLPGLNESVRTAAFQQQHFPRETEKLIADALRITAEHCWPLLGFGEKCFGRGEIDWNLDPLSARDWPLTYHADIELLQTDGSDVRVLWELNRLAHLITLGRAYAVTKDETYSAEFFRQVTSWRLQNPVARGANWSCAMEVALRAMNLLAAFPLFLHAPQMTEDTLSETLMILNQHGAHIRRNLEYSHIATSNHYLCDVAGLLWLGVLLPELEEAKAWREFALPELLKEMDQQVLADGADSEASTGYHRLKTEVFLYSFVLCHINGIDIEQKYWQKLRAMVDYIRAYLRPDGRAPLIGDTDSGQVLPMVRRSGDDHRYLLALGAAVFQEPVFKHEDVCPEEVLWVLGEDGVRDFAALPRGQGVNSQQFPDAGIYVLRQDDLYLLFNCSDSGLRGRGAHGHNDALSVEVSACGTAFIVDPGAYVYTADLHERHLFRSTTYHSTVEVDGVEQNTIDEQMPFIIGDEARARLIEWQPGDEADTVVAEHDGYRRLPKPVTHRRAVRFDKRNRGWLVDDSFTGDGEHAFAFRFHFAPGLESRVRPDGVVEVSDKRNRARLLISTNGLAVKPELEARFSSRDYGKKLPSQAVCWKDRRPLPLTVRFILVPVAENEGEDDRLQQAEDNFK
jgi:Heparinase II/III N-terminus/Heparinase II/III-like protein